MIIKSLEVGPYMANCYIVGSEDCKEGMIIDPGAEAEQILNIPRDLRVDIKFVVLTHGHADHIGVVREIGRQPMLRWLFMLMMPVFSKSNL